jgi:hypothetical protein
MKISVHLLRSPWLESDRYAVVMLQDAPSSIKLARGHLNSFIAVKSGYPFAIDDGIKISLPEIITYKHVLRAHILDLASFSYKMDG